MTNDRYIFRDRCKIDVNLIDDRFINMRIDLAGSLATRVIDTQEKAIREALIALGWTPPPESRVADSSHGETDMPSHRHIKTGLDPSNSGA